MHEPRPTRQPAEFQAALPGVKITTDLESRLLAYCAAHKRNMSQVVRDALEQLLLAAPTQ